ncbi:MAG: sugar phosphate isomerase/epimerase [Roseiflexaceae bacterium]|nr:sugar phosphate isomerase/epimerase [Roseiflexaceae bacterium]
MNTISFMTANFVAQQIDYALTEGWGQGDTATQRHFRPIDSFAERFEELLESIAEMGFSAIDLWGAHLHPDWASEEHQQTARALLDKYGFTVSSLATGVNSTLGDLARVCDIADAVGTQIIGGGGALLTREYDAVVGLLRERGIKLAFENHPEKTPDEVLQKIGPAADVIGVAIDTGWFGTQGYDAAHAVEMLADRVMLVHLKDVKGVGTHETCRYGQGIVPVEQVVRVMQSRGYTGGYSVEHEPELFDPTEDCRINLDMLRGWLGRPLRG